MRSVGRSSTPSTSDSAPAKDTLAPPTAPSRRSSWRSIISSKSKGTPKAAATPNLSTNDGNVPGAPPETHHQQDSRSPTLGSARHSISSDPHDEETTGTPPSADPHVTLSLGTGDSSKPTAPLFSSTNPDGYADNWSQENTPTGGEPSYQEYIDEMKPVFFGIKGNQFRRRAHAYNPHNRHDYKKKYPADRYGEEMGSSARVWKTACDETEKHDREMTMGWRDSIDALLVFAGLFSAVISAFLSQTYMALQPDIARITALLLLEQIAIARALDAGVPLSTIPITATSADLDSAAHVTSSTDYVTHGLWFTSLTLSLITALFAVVMKQWISSYMAPVSGNPQEQVQMRHFRFIGLDKWHVPAFFGFLPVLLHISLFLFLGGLVSFLSALDITMAVFTALFTGSAFVAYITANTLPVFFLDCPYKTPLSSSANYLWWFVKIGTRKLKNKIAVFRKKAGMMASELKAYASLATLESQAVHRFRHHLDTQLLVWLYDNTSNSSVRDIVLEAFAGLKSDSTSRPSRTFEPIASEVETAFNKHFTEEVPPRIIAGTDHADVERLGRALIQLDRKTVSFVTRGQFEALFHAGRCSSHLLNYHLLALGQAFMKVLTPEEKRKRSSYSPEHVEPVIINRIMTHHKSLDRPNVLLNALSSSGLPDPILLRLLCVNILDSHKISPSKAAADSVSVELIAVVIRRYRSTEPVWVMSHQLPAHGPFTGMSLTIAHLAVEYAYYRLFNDPWTFAQQESFASLTMEEMVCRYLRPEQHSISRARIMEISARVLESATLPGLTLALRDAVVASVLPMFETFVFHSDVETVVPSIWNGADLSSLEKLAIAAERLRDAGELHAAEQAENGIRPGDEKDMFISSMSQQDCDNMWELVFNVIWEIKKHSTAASRKAPGPDGVPLDAVITKDTQLPHASSDSFAHPERSGGWIASVYRLMRSSRLSRWSREPV